MRDLPDGFSALVERLPEGPINVCLVRVLDGVFHSVATFSSYLKDEAIEELRYESSLSASPDIVAAIRQAVPDLDASYGVVTEWCRSDSGPGNMLVTFWQLPA